MLPSMKGVAKERADLEPLYAWLPAEFGQDGFELLLVVAVLHLPARFHLVQRGHAYVDEALGEQLGLVAEQEREQQRPDVSTIHISIRQQDHLQMLHPFVYPNRHACSIRVREKGDQGDPGGGNGVVLLNM